MEIKNSNEFVGTVERVITHGGEARCFCLCKCSLCGKVERNTPETDFYTLNEDQTGPLVCEACFGPICRARLEAAGYPQPPLPDAEPVEVAEPVLICPECQSDDIYARHHEGNFLAPECNFNECADCGHQFGGDL